MLFCTINKGQETNKDEEKIPKNVEAKILDLVRPWVIKQSTDGLPSSEVEIEKESQKITQVFCDNLKIRFSEPPNAYDVVAENISGTKKTIKEILEVQLSQEFEITVSRYNTTGNCTSFMCTSAKDYFEFFCGISKNSSDISLVFFSEKNGSFYPSVVHKVPFLNYFFKKKEQAKETKKTNKKTPQELSQTKSSFKTTITAIFIVLITIGVIIFLITRKK